MLHGAISESDMTSMAPSSPRSPKRPVLYYVQSPSRDSHDGDKSSSMQTTPAYASPMESPSHLSYGRHSRSSSASRVSGGGYGWKGRSKSKGWPQSKCDDVIEEEGDYDPYGNGVSRRWLCQVMIWASGFVSAFCVFCFIIWGASRPFKPQITVKSLTVHNFYFGEGSDMTGVPTKMLTVSCSVKMNVYNSATFFGIHVSSVPVSLMYSELTVATGELKRYFQPRKSHRTVSVNLEGTKVPLYGAGAGLAASEDNGGVPMTLVFEVTSIGNVVGKLVKPRHRRRVACSLAIDSRSNKAIKFKEDSCTYL